MKVAFIGGGNMAGALIGGMLQATFNASEIEVAEIDSARRAELTERFRVDTHERPGAWLQACEIIVLAVKPQQVRDVAAAIQPHLKQQLVLSIAAGVRATSIGQWLATGKVVRAMPNMPALIRAGISAAIALPDVTTAEKESGRRNSRRGGYRNLAR